MAFFFPPCYPARMDTHDVRQPGPPSPCYLVPDDELDQAAAERLGGHIPWRVIGWGAVGIVAVLVPWGVGVLFLVGVL